MRISTEMGVRHLKRVVAVILTIFMIMTLFACGGASPSSKKSNSSSATSTYEMDHATYCAVYMKVSDVNVTHSGSYAYVKGTITNNGSYQIKFVKVKASCLDSSGNVIDTDWTYAVDSSWLDPGESNTFEMMVKDENSRIKDAKVTVEYD